MTINPDQCKPLLDLKYVRLHYDMRDEEVFAFAYRFDLLDSDSSWTFLATMPLPLEPSEQLLEKCKAINAAYYDWLPWNLWLGQYLLYSQQKSYLHLLPGEMADLVTIANYARFHPATTRLFAFSTTEEFLSRQLLRNTYFESVAKEQLERFETGDFRLLKRAQQTFEKEHWNGFLNE